MSRNGFFKNPSYMEDVYNFPKPVTVKNLRSFLGLVNFQWKFVPNCSVIMKPYSSLTGGKSSAKLQWTTKLDSAYETLKLEMRNDLLSFPDYSPNACPVELYTDASALGVGACLMQCQDGTLRRIAFASIAFTSQQNYSTLVCELAAIHFSKVLQTTFPFWGRLSCGAHRSPTIDVFSQYENRKLMFGLHCGRCC